MMNMWDFVFFLQSDNEMRNPCCNLLVKKCEPRGKYGCFVDFAT